MAINRSLGVASQEASDLIRELDREFAALRKELKVYRKIIKLGRMVFQSVSDAKRAAKLEVLKIHAETARTNMAYMRRLMK